MRLCCVVSTVAPALTLGSRRLLRGEFPIGDLLLPMGSVNCGYSRDYSRRLFGRQRGGDTGGYDVFGPYDVDSADGASTTFTTLVMK
jgi:hypothetical protein